MMHDPIRLPADLHPFECGCAECEPYVPSVPPRLTAVDLGKLAVAGALTGSAIAFAIDWRGALDALISTVWW